MAAPQPTTPGTPKPKLTPAMRLDRDITHTGWGAILLLVTAQYYLNFNGAILALLVAAIMLGTNLSRLVKGLRVHYLSVTLCLLALVHAWVTWLEPWGSIGAVVVYLIAKFVLRDRIR